MLLVFQCKWERRLSQLRLPRLPVTWTLHYHKICSFDCDRVLRSLRLDQASRILLIYEQVN